MLQWLNTKHYNHIQLCETHIQWVFKYWNREHLSIFKRYW